LEAAPNVSIRLLVVRMKPLHIIFVIIAAILFKPGVQSFHSTRSHVFTRRNHQRVVLSSNTIIKTNQRQTSTRKLHALANTNDTKGQNLSRNTLSAQKILVLLNILCFLIQVQSSVSYAPVLKAILMKHKIQEIPQNPVLQFIFGSTPTLLYLPKNPSLIVANSEGLFTADFMNQRLFSTTQPHRFFTSGFLHANALHLGFNMRYLWSMPKWIEEHNRALYLSTFLVSIVTCNVAQDYAWKVSGVLGRGLGASGGILGLQGLMWVMLQRMGKEEESKSILKGILWLTMIGCILPGIGAAGHAGGFVGGVVVGCLFGPQYQSKSKLIEHVVQKYRQKPGKLPLWSLWAVAAIPFLFQSRFRSIPNCIWLGIRQPGFLSQMWMTAE